MLKMIFNGHKLYKINKNWVFDLTDFTGYKVIWANGSIVDYMRAFRTVESTNKKGYEFIKFMTVPVGVMRKSEKLIEFYFREAMIYGQ